MVFERLHVQRQPLPDDIGGEHFDFISVGAEYDALVKVWAFRIGGVVLGSTVSFVIIEFHKAI